MVVTQCIYGYVDVFALKQSNFYHIDYIECEIIAWIMVSNKIKRNKKNQKLHRNE